MVGYPSFHMALFVVDKVKIDADLFKLSVIK